ncbi:MAG TPA: SusD/RagB family nutrient-binding outer membrane lipoprotein, partial [Saprospiraceae bacterium]|nr:SusD/RagB family nutrient-binding outer membrane lipoprotein [Saprospiraceae bacterium]
MKSNIIKIGMLCIILTFVSCEDYLDINKDPSFPQAADGFSVLPPLFSQMARGEVFDTRYVGQYIQNWNWITA